MDRETKREIFNLKLNKLLETINDGQISLDTGENNKQKRKIVGTSVYDKRYQAQKEIIACQKATISEQKQTIEKLKLQNASLESEVVFLKNLTEHLKRNSIRKEEEEEKEANDKIKNVSSNDKYIENPSRGSDILLRMQKREEERKKRRQQIKEQKINKERLEKILLAQKEEEERLKSIEAKKRKEQEEIDKKIAAEEKLKRLQARKQIALFKLKTWQNNYFAYIGFWKWTLYIKLIHTKRNIVLFRIRRFFAMRYFERWLFNVSIIKEERLQQARNHYLKTLQTKVIKRWKNFTIQKKHVRETIEECINKIYLHKIIIRWKILSKEIKLSREEKLKIVSERYDRFLKTIYFIHWKELPKKLQEKREQEHRLRTWHSRVKEILPDFDAE